MFDIEQIDNTNGFYNFNTGLFTVPLNGRYKFDFHLLFRNYLDPDEPLSMKSAMFFIGVDDKIVSTFWTSRSTLGYLGFDSSFYSTEIYLMAGQKVGLYLDGILIEYGDSLVGFGEPSFFQGQLMRPY